jgi:hypothetical protein
MEEVKRLIGDVEDEDLRGKLTAAWSIFLESVEVRLRESVDSLRQHEDQMTMLKTFKVVATNFFNDNMIRKNLAGGSSAPYVGIFKAEMAKHGYELRDGEWQEIDE